MTTYRKVTKSNLRPVISMTSPLAGAILFGGDRLSVVSWGVVAFEGTMAVGLATFSERGEAGEGASVIGLWVKPDRRGEGIGRGLLVAMQVESGRSQLKADAITVAGLQTCRKVSGLLVNDQTFGGFEIPY